MGGWGCGEGGPAEEDEDEESNDKQEVNQIIPSANKQISIGAGPFSKPPPVCGRGLLRGSSYSFLYVALAAACLLPFGGKLLSHVPSLLFRQTERPRGAPPPPLDRRLKEEPSPLPPPQPRSRGATRPLIGRFDQHKEPQRALPESAVSLLLPTCSECITPPGPASVRRAREEFPEKTSLKLEKMIHFTAQRSWPPTPLQGTFFWTGWRPRTITRRSHA